MMLRTILVFVSALGLAASHALAGDWVQLGDETDDRLVADASVGIDDTAEKDYAWGDVDHDLDADLIVVRKQPWTTSGAHTNVLLLNEDGVLVDRTAEFASASDVEGDQGFLTPTNDRDVVLVDVNGDGWLDIVTGTTHSLGQPKHIGHPRIYINLGEDGDGNWLGFRYEASRIPQLLTIAGDPVNPCFNAVAAGDTTGDGYPELYFADSDLGSGGGAVDLNDRLLLNDGTGVFVDATTLYLTPVMVQSGHATAAAIVDMNLDGRKDIVVSDNLNPPTGVSIAYNGTTSAPGFFDAFEIVYTNSPTYVSAGDLNEDHLPDLYVTDDGVDRYLLHQGNGADGLADFSAFAIPASSNGFGGNSVLSDLNNDGFDDILLADVDNDIPGCSRLLNFYRNPGVIPDSSILDVVPDGIEESDRTGTFDVATLDINSDGFLDLVIGRCEGTSVWIQNSSSTPADLDDDGDVDFADLLTLLDQWGTCDPKSECLADLDDSGIVSFNDLLILLANWSG